MYISNLLAVGTSAMLLLVGVSSNSLACSPPNAVNPQLTVGCVQSSTAEVLSLEENLPNNDLKISSEKINTVANVGRFRNYKGQVIDTKDYIRARY